MAGGADDVKSIVLLKDHVLCSGGDVRVRERAAVSHRRDKLHLGLRLGVIVIDVILQGWERAVLGIRFSCAHKTADGNHFRYAVTLAEQVQDNVLVMKLHPCILRLRGDGLFHAADEFRHFRRHVPAAALHLNSEVRWAFH